MFSFILHVARAITSMFINMETLYGYYVTYVYKYADQRIVNMPLMGSPIPTILIFGAYWLIIKMGPQFMANRPAYNIKPLIQAYNLLQIVLCGCFGFWGLYLLLQKDFACLTHRTDSPYDLHIIFLSWVYCMLKYLDLIDTVFFVLRKKFHLLTTLHTYHHSLMAVSAYSFGRYFPGGELCLLGGLNTIVHSIMYGYYFYAQYSNGKQNIWWKKYITQMQIGQFCLLLVYYLWKLFSTTCDYPKYILAFALTQVVTMLWMFSNYYYNAFIKPKEIKSEANKNVEANNKKVK